MYVLIGNFRYFTIQKLEGVKFENRFEHKGKSYSNNLDSPRLFENLEDCEIFLHEQCKNQYLPPLFSAEKKEALIKSQLLEISEVLNANA